MLLEFGNMHLDRSQMKKPKKLTMLLFWFDLLSFSLILSLIALLLAE